MNIYQKISAIMQDVRYLAKDDKVEFGSTKYKAISEEKVTSILREKMIERGLVVYPVSMVSERAGNLTRVDAVWRMVNVDDPTEFIDIATCGEGADSQDKGSGKAMTYAYKYMWLRTFGIPTGEDPDKISSAELDDRQERESIIKLVKTMAQDEQRLNKFVSAWTAKKYGSSCYLDTIRTDDLRTLKVDLARAMQNVAER